MLIIFCKKEPAQKSPVSDPPRSEKQVDKEAYGRRKYHVGNVEYYQYHQDYKSVVIYHRIPAVPVKLKYLRDDVEPVKRRHRQQIEHHEHYVYGHYVIYHKIERFRHSEHDAVCLADYQLEYQRGYESDHKIRCNTCQRRKKFVPSPVLVVARINGHRLSPSEAGEYQRQKSDRIDMSQRVERKPAVHLGRRVSQPVGHIGMGCLVESESDYYARQHQKLRVKPIPYVHVGIQHPVDYEGGNDYQDGGIDIPEHSVKIIFHPFPLFSDYSYILAHFSPV